MEKVLMSTDGIDYIFSAYDGEPIVPDTPFSRPCRQIYVGVGGDLKVTMESGTQLLYKNIPTPCFINIRATLVDSASTTCTDMLALV